MDIGNVMMSFLELISVFLIYNVIINKKIHKRLLTYILSAGATSIIYGLLRSKYNIDAIVIIIGAIFLISILISKFEKKETIIITIELIFSGLILMFFELFTIFILGIIFGDSDINIILYISLTSIIMFLLILILFKYTKKIEYNFTEFISKYKIINIILLNVFLFFLFLKILVVNDLMRTNILIQITILGLILIGINIYFYIYLYNTINKKKKTEIQKSFNPLINELIGKVKSNEHEYKNHLNAIYGIAQVAKKEELGDKIKEYISSIISENESFSKLLHIENTIVKAVLYNKLQRAEKLGVDCAYEVKSDLKNIMLDDSELTVILSNLLNNAIEATSLIEKKQMKILIDENEEKYCIRVSNNTQGVVPDIINNMFKIGYSTKGEGRGYGLYNVKKLIDKYKGKINVSLEEEILYIEVLFDK